MVGAAVVVSRGLGGVTRAVPGGSDAITAVPNVAPVTNGGSSARLKCSSSLVGG